MTSGLEKMVFDLLEGIRAGDHTSEPHHGLSKS